MSKRIKENIWILILVILLGTYFYFGVNYLDKFVIKHPQNIEQPKHNNH